MDFKDPNVQKTIVVGILLVIVGYVLWVTGVSGGFAVLVTPLLPYVTVGVSDYASRREADRRMRRSYAGRK